MEDLLKTVSLVISPIAKPEHIQWAPICQRQGQEK